MQNRVELSCKLSMNECRNRLSILARVLLIWLEALTCMYAAHRMDRMYRSIFLFLGCIRHGSRVVAA